MGAEGAINIVYRHELEGLTGKAFEEKKADLISKYEEEFANPYKAAELGFMDAVILPEETRKRVYEYLVALRNKKQEKPKRKHGNIQL
jgi:propionyl-CoA carboxylase beta chain